MYLLMKENYFGYLDWEIGIYDTYDKAKSALNHYSNCPDYALYYITKLN